MVKSMTGYGLDEATPTGCSTLSLLGALAIWAEPYLAADGGGLGSHGHRPAG